MLVRAAALALLATFLSVVPSTVAAEALAGESRVNIQTGRTQFAYGTRAEVTVRLTAASANRVVSLYAQQEGEDIVLLARGEVTGEGLVVSYRYVRTTTFAAVYEGDADTPGATDEATVRVPTEIDVFAERSLRRQGKTYLYEAGKRAYFRIRVRPSSPSFRTRLLLFAEGGGPRRKIGSTDLLKLSSRGVAKVYLTGTGPLVGPDLSVRAEWYETPRSNVGGRNRRHIEFRFVR